MDFQGLIIIATIALALAIAVRAPISLAFSIEYDTMLRIKVLIAGFSFYSSEQANKKRVEPIQKKRVVRKKYFDTLLFFRKVLLNGSMLQKGLRLFRSTVKLLKVDSYHLKIEYGDTDPYVLSLIQSQWFVVSAWDEKECFLFVPKYGEHAFSTEARMNGHTTLFRIMRVIIVLIVSIPYWSLFTYYREARK